MSKRSFSTAARRAEAKAIEFDIDGIDLRTKDVIPAAATTGLSAASLDERPAKQVVAILEWFEIVLDEPSNALLLEKMKAPVDPIDDELLVELFQWLLGEIAGRPTSRPSDSSGGPSTTSTSSTDGQPAAASTP